MAPRRSRTAVRPRTPHGSQRRALGHRRADNAVGGGGDGDPHTAGADTFALSLRIIPCVVRQGLTCFARRDLRDHDRTRVLLGGRFSPLGPVGIGLIFFWDDVKTRSIQSS